MRKTASAMAKVREGRTRTRRGGKEAHAVLAFGLLDGTFSLGHLDERLLELVFFILLAVGFKRANRDGTVRHGRVCHHAFCACPSAWPAAGECNRRG